MAIDVEIVLKAFDIPFVALDEDDVQKSEDLQLLKTIIMPGGYTEQCIRRLGSNGCDKLREFVAKGGGYIGICLGAYAAPRIGIVKSTMKRRCGLGGKRVRITAPAHPIFRGEDRTIMTMYYQNGPSVSPCEDEPSLAIYEDGSTAILSATYGEGKIVIFSPHPEKRMDTVRLLLNSIDFCTT